MTSKICYVEQNCSTWKFLIHRQCLRRLRQLSCMIEGSLWMLSLLFSIARNGASSLSSLLSLSSLSLSFSLSFCWSCHVSSCLFLWLPDQVMFSHHSCLKPWVKGHKSLKVLYGSIFGEVTFTNCVIWGLFWWGLICEFVLHLLFSATFGSLFFVHGAVDNAHPISLWKSNIKCLHQQTHLLEETLLLLKTRLNKRRIR